MVKFNFSKPLVVLFTGALLWIALSLVESKVVERQQFRFQAEQSVAESWTHSQTLLGPILIVPYLRTYQEKLWNKELRIFENIVQVDSKNFYILPQNADFDISLKSETRSRGIYPVPVYHAKIDITGNFNTTKLKRLFENPEISSNGTALLSFSVSDSRGIVTLPLIALNQTQAPSLSGSQLPFAPQGFSAELNNSMVEKPSFEFQTQFELNGMTAIHFLAAAKNQQINLASDWAHPMFEGAFLPLNRKITDDGYTAEWKTSQYSLDFESLLSDCMDSQCPQIFTSSFGVKQINPIDVYRQSQRAVGYGILFILVTFIAFALVEVLQGISLHPVQYGLAGANLSIFFLLLLALSEHVSFGMAYFIAAFSVLSLLYYYLKHSFKRSSLAQVVSIGISTLYGILFLIIQSEDHALLAGSLLLFSLLGAIIISTKNINWNRF